MSNDAVILTLVTVLVGAGLPFVSEELNKLFHANEKKALALAGIASGVLAVVVLFLTGGLSLQDLTLANFTVVFTAVYTVGNIVFNVIKKSMGWNITR